jgi:hypothetical protein
MFASAWQLLTAIFFFSALTKLVYKLIKEDRTTTTRRIVVVRTQQQAHLEQEEPVQRRARPVQQQQEQQQPIPLLQAPPPAPQQQSIAEDIRLAGEAPIAYQQQQEQQQQEQQQAQDEEEQLDEDDEFEETLSWAFQSQQERAQLEEQRRTRRLTRQQFRRQLNRLNVSAAGAPSELDDEDVQGSQQEFEDELELELGGQQQSPTSSGEYFDANVEFAPSGGQNAAQQQQQWIEADDDEPQQSRAVSFHRNEVQQDDHNEQRQQTKQANSDGHELRAHSVRELSWSVDGTEADELKRKHDSSASQRAANLTRLIGEAFLIEPLKLTCAILGQTFRAFCAFLDFIEGIETTPPNTGQVGLLGGSVVAGARVEHEQGGRQQWAERRRLRDARAGPQAAAAAATTTTRRQQQAAAGGAKWRSNYFHRRYLARRSLSAALLNDSDRDEPSEQTDEANDAELFGRR